MSNFLGAYASKSQLPLIDNVSIFPGDSAYTLDDGAYWIAKQPSAPPGAQPAWLFIDTLRGGPGPQGPAGVGLPGPQGQIGPPGMNGAPGNQGPPGRNAFSFLSVLFRVPDVATQPPPVSVSDSSWMVPGLLIYIPGAGTFTVVGSPPTPFTVNLVNSGDPNNAPAGTMIAAGTGMSPANLRGPLGPTGQVGPAGPPGPQGVSGTSVYTTLKQQFSIPTDVGVAFVVDSKAFAKGQIVYVEAGQYFSVQDTDDTQNTLTLVNQNYPGGQAPGTIIPIGNTVSGTGPQGPQGLQGPQGIQGPQGLQGVAMTGTVAMWPAAVPPGGWLLCQGQSVTIAQYPALYAVLSTTWGSGSSPGSTFNLPDLRDCFPVGASATYPLTSAGGEAAHALTIGELALHAHAIADKTHTHPDSGHTHTASTGSHSHTATDSGHVHSITDKVHSHTISGIVASGNMTGGPQASFNRQAGSMSTDAAATGITGTNAAAAVISIAAAGNIGVTVASAATGLQAQKTGITTTDNVGSGTAHNNLPPYKAFNFIIKA